MKKYVLLIFLTIGSLLLLPGCIIKPAAKSIVSIKRADGLGQPATFGLKNAYWLKDEDGIHIVASGWHPREHETYWFVISEPYYAYLFRKIILNPSKNDSEGIAYKVETQLSGAYIPSKRDTDYDWFDIYDYEAQADVQVKESSNSRRITFSDVKLYPKDENMPVLVMEGKITAQPNANNAYLRVLDSKP